MKTFLRIIYCIAAMLPALRAAAQDSPEPAIAYVYPAGAKAPSRTLITIGGRGFSDVERVIVSGSGVSAEIKNITVPFRQGQVPALRFKLERKYIAEHPGALEKIESLGVDGQAWLRKQVMAVREYVEALAEADASYFLRVISGDALAETVDVELEISADAEPGVRNLWLLSPEGLSIPFNFEIDTLPEHSMPSYRQTLKYMAKLPENWGRSRRLLWPKMFAIPSEREVEKIKLPCIVNAQVVDAKTRIFSFDATKGSRIVFDLRAQRILPYISDAVPGWFQAVMVIRDSEGGELAYCDDWFHEPDPFISFEVPRDGTYTVEVYDAVYRSREDFVFRMYAGEFPALDRTFPAKTADDPNGEVRFLKIPSKTMACVKVEGKAHVYALKLKKGQRVVMETFARRAGSPLDSYMQLYDSSSKLLAASDDFEDLSCGLVTHHADSHIEFTAPSSGDYFLHVGDTSKKASPHHFYELTVSEPRFDFEARTEIPVLNMRPGSTAEFGVKVFRRDSMKYPITIKADSLPEGWSLSHSEIPADASEWKVYLRTTPSKEQKIVTLKLKAEAVLNGKKLSKQVVPCRDMMQAFYYRHLVPVADFMVSLNAGSRAYKGFSNFVLDTEPSSAQMQEGSDKLVLRLGKARPKTPLWRLSANILGSDKFESAKFFVWKGILYAQLKPIAGKLKAGDSGELSMDLLLKQGKALIPFDKAGPFKYRVVAANKEKKAVENKPAQKKAKKSAKSGK